MKVIKYLGIGVAGVVGLLVVVVLIASVVIDGAFVKSRLERYMKEEKQRTLKIEGDPKVRIFPVAGLSLGKTSLSEPGNDKVFVALDSLEVGVKVMPLLSGEIAVDAMSLAGLKLNVVKSKDGRFNFQDLAEGKKDAASKDGKEGKAEPAKPAEPPKLRIAEIKIENAQITYRDEKTGQEIAVNGFSFKTGRLEDDAPSPVTLEAAIAGKRPEVGLKVSMNGSARMNLARKAFAVSKLDLRVGGAAANLRGLDLRVTGDAAADGSRDLVDINGLKVQATGTVDRDALNVNVSAPRIEITPAKASGSAVTGEFKLAGPGRNVNAKLEIAAVSGSASALSIPKFGLDLDALAEGTAVKLQLSTPIAANLAAKTWDLPKIAASLTASGPKIPQKSVTIPIEASFKADLAKQTMATALSTKFDESNIQAKFGATKFEPLAANFDINIDKLNLDRYLPASSEKDSGGDPPVDLSPLRGKTVNGAVKVGALQVKKAKLANIKLEMKLANGRLDVTPFSANLYEGSINGSLVADANGNQIAVKQTLQGVSVNPLLRDVADKDIVEGKGDINLDVTMAGATVGALKRALNGSAKVQLKDGAYKGINLGETFRKAGSLGSKSGTQSADKSQKTDFSEMSASFVIKKGVARNDDLAMKSPFLRLAGSGDIDIGNSKLDYTAKASVVATATGQQGREDAAGVTVPVKIYGSFDAVKYDIQYGALFSGIGKGLGGLFGGGGGAKAQEGATAKSGAPSAPAAAADAVRDRVKGLFGR